MFTLTQYRNAMTLVVDGVVRERRDDAARLFRAYDEQGSEASTLAYDAAENADADARAAAATEATNEAALLAKARGAISGNKDFLSLASPTNAQTLAQVKALTRQANALIKLEVRDLLDTTGT